MRFRRLLGQTWAVGFEVFTGAKLGVVFEPSEGFRDGVAAAGHLEAGVAHGEDVVP